MRRPPPVSSRIADGSTRPDLRAQARRGVVLGGRVGQGRIGYHRVSWGDTQATMSTLGTARYSRVAQQKKSNFGGCSQYLVWIKIQLRLCIDCTSVQHFSIMRAQHRTAEFCSKKKSNFGGSSQVIAKL